MPKTIASSRHLKHSPMHRQRSPGGGFTLIELLIVITVLATLLGLLFPVVNLIRANSLRAKALAQVNSLTVAFEAYLNEDDSRQYPTEDAVFGLVGGVQHSSVNKEIVDLIENMRVFSRAGSSFNASDQLLDPWQQPLRYTLSRPAPATGTEVLNNWNWNDETGDVARKGRLRDPATGLPQSSLTNLPYPYIWSLGPSGFAEDASDWIFSEDGQ